MKKGGFVYILTNKTKTVLYIGVTDNLIRRTFQHKFEKGSLFTSKYNVKNLVYYECYPTIMEAIAREKVLKGMTRLKKEYLIDTFNPNWTDLYEKVLNE